MLKSVLDNLKKDFYTIPTGVRLIVLVLFVRAIGWGFVDPFKSFYLTQFYESYTFVGLLTSIFSFSALLAIIPLMKLTDRVRETTLISDGELLYFLVILGYVFAGIYTSLPLLIITLVFTGIANTFVVVGTEAYIRKHNGKGGGNGPFAFYVALSYLGWIIGMLLASFGVNYYDFNSMFLFVAPSILISFFILPRIRERGIRSLIGGFKRYFHTREDFFSIFKDCKEINPKAIFFFVLAFFDGMIRMFSFVFVPLFGLAMNLDFSQIALLMAAMYSPFILSFFFSEVSDKLKRMNMISVGLFIGALSFVSLYFIVNSFFIVMLTASVSFSMAIVRPAYNGAITRLTPRRMLGEVTGFNNFIERLGRIIGPIVTGVIADAYGIKTAFLFIAVIALLLGTFSIFFRGYDYAVSD